MSNRFKDLKPQKTNMFRNKKQTIKQSSLKQNNRWSKLESTQKNENKFKNKSTFKTNSRWDNLKTDEKDNRNSFKYKKPERTFNKERNGYRNHRNYRGRRPRDNSPGIFTNATMINGVPQVKGAVQKSFNIMDSIKIKQKPKKKSPKKKKTKKNNSQNFMELDQQKETEEEKKQKELWKQQLIAQYAYEYETEEENDEDNDEDIDEN
tara:strand:- start:9030 stop:9650 length:621 start_codon:yes stop_codon:yes gene_type:complete